MVLYFYLQMYHSIIYNFAIRLIRMNKLKKNEFPLLNKKRPFI